MLRIHVLGEFRVEVDGVALGEGSWPRRDVKLLLQLLAVRHAHRFSREAVAECLWPGVAAETARNRLYNIVYVLRGVLEPQRGARAPSSYVHSSADMLHLGPAAALWIDADAFEQALDAAVPAEPAAAQGLLEQAAALYRGPLLDGTAEDRWAGSDRIHLAQRYRSALRSLAQRYQALGQMEAAIGALQRLVRTDPTDEAVQRELIQALADTGRRAEALAQYRLCREVLATELGVAPGAQTAALAQQLRALNATSADTPSAGPTAGAANASPSAPHRHQLPHGLSSLIGRDTELAALRAMCECTDTRLLTLTGVGGVGKTQLALRLGAQLQGHFGHGVAFVSLAALAPHSEPQLVAGTVAHALGLAQSGAGTPEDLVQRYLADKQLLLLLDNLEHLLPAAAPLLSQWLVQAPQVLLLATSRTPLHVHGERLFTLGPLALPGLDAGKGTLAGLGRVAAVALFVQRAAAVSTSFELTAENAAAISAICTRLDGLPLAIELAAARCRLFSPTDLLARLDQRFALLGHGLLDSPERHRSLTAVLDWSHELLDPEVRRLFAAFSVFRGGATLQAVQAVCATDNADLLDDALDCLLDHHLLDVQDRPEGARRFVMLETVRTYAVERSTARGNGDAIAAKHAAWYSALAIEFGPRLVGPEQKRLLDELEVDHDNLRAALDWAVVHDTALSLRFAACLSEFWYVRGHFSEGRRWYRKILAAAASTPAGARAKATHAASRLAWRQGDVDSARALIEQSIALSRAAGDQCSLASSLNGLSMIVSHHGENKEALEMLTESLRIGRLSQNPGITAVALANLGTMLAEQTQFERAMPMLHEAQASLREIGHINALIHCLCHLGEHCHTQGHYDSASDRYREALVLARDVDNRSQQVTILIGIAELQLSRLQLSEAVTNAKEALDICDPLGDVWQAAMARSVLGRAALYRRRLQEAECALRQSQTTFEATGITKNFDDCLAALACVALARKDVTEAQRLFMRLIAMSDRMAMRNSPVMLELGAALCLARGHAHECALALGVSAQHRRAIGVPRHPAQQLVLADTRAAAIQSIGSQAFEAAFSEAVNTGLKHALSGRRAAAGLSQLLQPGRVAIHLEPVG
jgi:predicted ATPase/DNA-binding SARP family transcriptional activator